MTTQLSILFMAIKSRINTKGEAPVYCRLTYNQRQKRFMIGCTVSPVIWDQTKQHARGKTAKAETVNEQVKLMVKKIYKAEADLLKLGDPFDVTDIVNRVQGINKTACRMLMQVYQLRYLEMKKLEGIDFKASSIQKFVQMAQAVKRFLMHHYNANDIALSKLNIVFLHALESYLKVEGAMKLITVNKVIQKLKSVTSTAIDNGWMSANPFPGHKFKHDRIEVIYLTIAELEQLEHFEFAQKRLARVRDIFLFSVYTGLHYLDAMSLTDENIVTREDGKLWIIFRRQKTGKLIHIPMLKNAISLMDKFRYDALIAHTPSATIVPHISNQKVNSYLKEVAEVAGIKKALTHKTARKTFGSALLYYNVPMKIVSELMGHSSVIVTERHYAHVEIKKLGEAISGVDALLALPTP